MKRSFLAFAVISAAFFIQGCAGGLSSASPKDTLLAFFESLSKKDIDGARKYATADSKSMLDIIEMGMKMGTAGATADKYDRDRMELGDAVISGDNATVAVKDKKSGESVNFPLKKEGGAWKVAFDMGSMMQIGMDKMKETNPAGADSLRSQINELKKINIDSLQGVLKEGMNSLDSLKKLTKQKANQ